MDKNEVKQLSGLTLAYVGDAIWEAHIRTYLIQSGWTKPVDLHQNAVRFVSAEGQAAIIQNLMIKNQLDEEEKRIFKRGRNSSPHSTAKNASKKNYHLATGFEALIGYLYLMGKNQRIEVLSKESIAFIEEEHNGRKKT